MFKFPNLPSPKATPDELADFIEVVSWLRGFCSSTDVIRYLSVVDDNVDIDGEEFSGCEDQEDEHLVALEGVFELLSDRGRICEDGYPFELGPVNTTSL
jgi:hypothetical protein